MRLYSYNITVITHNKRYVDKNKITVLMTIYFYNIVTELLLNK